MGVPVGVKIRRINRSGMAWPSGKRKAAKGKDFAPKRGITREDRVECEIFVLCIVRFSFYLLEKLEYDFEWLSGEDESVHNNNASMIEMLTSTIPTKFLYAGLGLDHCVHVCVGLTLPTQTVKKDE